MKPRINFGLSVLVTLASITSACQPQSYAAETPTPQHAPRPENLRDICSIREIVDNNMPTLQEAGSQCVIRYFMSASNTLIFPLDPNAGNYYAVTISQDEGVKIVRLNPADGTLLVGNMIGYALRNGSLFGMGAVTTWDYPQEDVLNYMEQLVQDLLQRNPAPGNSDL